MTFDELLHLPHPFLTGMCESHLRMLANHATHVHFPIGARVFHEGETAEQFYLIQPGKVGLQAHSAGHPVPIQSIGSGEVLGWSWLSRRIAGTSTRWLRRTPMRSPSQPRG